MIDYSDALAMIERKGNRYRRKRAATYLVGCQGGRSRYAWLTETVPGAIDVTLFGNLVARLHPEATVLFPEGFRPHWCTATTRDLLKALTGDWGIALVGTKRRPRNRWARGYEPIPTHGTGFTFRGEPLRPATFVNVTGDTSTIEAELALAALAR